MRTSLLLLAIGAVAVVCSAVATPAAALRGGWHPIKNIDDPAIQALGEWAVAEHVKQANDGLKFKKVVRGREHTYVGVNFRLTIRAVNLDGEEGAYRADVHEDHSSPPNGARKLVSFSAARRSAAGRKN